MKAMILAAGLGTRLLPLTQEKPKPLFLIAGRPLLDILIRTLQDSHCEAVIINTHHLAEMIDEFVQAQDYGIPVHTRYEPTILDTGGAIKNVEDFWDENPLLVINGDIFTNIDLAQIYRFHLGHRHLVTLALHDYSQFNNVWVDSKDHITGFGDTAPCPPTAPDVITSANDRQLAFTGIQVLDPQVLSFIPERTPCSIIDIYCEMIRAGITLKAFVPGNHYWHDIGTMAGYHGAAREALARKALAKAVPEIGEGILAWSELKGDGSDRTWHRVSLGKTSVIMVDHGPPPEDRTCEADSFVDIGQHLLNKGVPVPHIYGYDRPTGLVALQDLGDLHLQTVVRRTGDQVELLAHYKAVIDLLITMAVEGAKGFNPAFTYQTPYYDQRLILEKEARYFVTAFLNGYKGLRTDFEKLKEGFELFAKRALETGLVGFLHRDFQSRNILVRNEKYYVIDFQGGRLGPLPYDLASLLIDPYVELPEDIQQDLLAYYLDRLSGSVPVNRQDFLRAYRYCAINRNLQILGAFGFLSRVKEKTDFEAYIPAALASLKIRLSTIESDCPQLVRIVNGI
ncbi:MAG: phosphotransferase [Deltaproteobacteria bacterium]|nr:phosphotransferase [Deltaproteobacteria bacterium]